MSNKDDKFNKLTEKQKIFCREYIIDWNGTRSYQVAYPDVNKTESARAAASRLLTNVNISEYIELIQQELEKNAGISRLKVLLEHKKIAFSSIAHLHNTWINRKEFEDLTDDQKACIEIIDTKIHTIENENNKNPIKTEHIKIKLYDKQKALDSITKMLGYNEAEKHDHTSNGEKITGIDLSKLTYEELKTLAEGNKESGKD